MKEPPSIIVQLVHIHGPLKGEIQEFSSNEILIGRHPSCDLQFPKELVVISRNHAHIIRDGNRFKIVDSSTNGTFVNGNRIKDAWLKDGDVIFFTDGGPKVSFLTRQGEIAQEKSVPPSQAKPLSSPITSSPKNPQAPPPPSYPSTSFPQSDSRPSPSSTRPQYPQESVPNPPIQNHPSSQNSHSNHIQNKHSQPEFKIEPVRVPLVIQYGVVLKSFNQLPITMGKDQDCDLPLDHPSLERKQIQVFFSRDRYWIKDLSGQNSVLINSQTILSPSVLTPGDKIFLTKEGPAFQFMEGGRMAEIDVPKPEKIKEEKDKEPENKKGIKSSQKKGSFFKNIFS